MQLSEFEIQMRERWRGLDQMFSSIATLNVVLRTDRRTGFMLIGVIDRDQIAEGERSLARFEMPFMSAAIKLRCNFVPPIPPVL